MSSVPNKRWLKVQRTAWRLYKAMGYDNAMDHAIDRHFQAGRHGGFWSAVQHELNQILKQEDPERYAKGLPSQPALNKVQTDPQKGVRMNGYDL